MITDMKAYQKEYCKKHKKEKKEYDKAYREAHKKEIKAYREAHKKEMKAYREAHKDYFKDYQKADVNSFGKPKLYIRTSSNHYLKRYGTKIPGYQIHHCFTYDDPKKFIYCSKEKHLEIHQYLRDNNINADTNHYEQIKHLFDDTVVVYGI